MKRRVLPALLFQSTPSARRATRSAPARHPHQLDFNPRPPRGGRPHDKSLQRRVKGYFNPRPPRGGRLLALSTSAPRSVFQSTPSARRATSRPVQLHSNRARFQSTPSARRATRENIYANPLVKISIHALREEGDEANGWIVGKTKIFQSTPSARRATAVLVKETYVQTISIHALREEGDGRRWRWTWKH